MRRICIIILLLPWICYGCATYTNKPQADVKSTRNIGELIEKKLLNNERIALIIFITQATIDGRSDTQVVNKFQIINEGAYLKSYGHYKNFNIVNRNYLKNNLDEITLSGSGLISNETRAKIGELTGATHLLLIEASHSSHLFVGSSTTFYEKLINIQNGQVLAIDTAKIEL